MDGVLLVDKPENLTSHDVVDAVRRIAGTRAVGHAGTLDPFATGLLVLGVGKATKELTALVGLDKEYAATLKLGETSDTFDVEGKISVVVPAKAGTQPGMDSHLRGNDFPTVGDIETALDQFRGGYEQKAPLHSAKKVRGKKLYELARKGEATEDMRPVKRVTISDLTVMDYAWPTLRLRVSCSSGTYIRSLADDIGRALGVGAYLTELRRTRIGGFTVEDAIPLNALTAEALKTRLFSTLDKTIKY